MKLDGAITFAAQKQAKREQGNQTKKKRTKVDVVEPTPEQREKNNFGSLGMANHITPVIDTLFKRDDLTASEYIALGYYSQQANAANKSPLKSNLDRSQSGGGDRPMTLVCPFKTETDRIERMMGFSSRTARAICVENYSLSQWAIHTKGGREHKGRMVPKRDRITDKDGKVTRLSDVDEILLELKRAARRIKI